MKTFTIRELRERSCAVELFRANTVRAGPAAKIAGVTYPRFLECLAQLCIPVVDYDPSSSVK